MCDTISADVKDGWQTAVAKRKIIAVRRGYLNPHAVRRGCGANRRTFPLNGFSILQGPHRRNQLVGITNAGPRVSNIVDGHPIIAQRGNLLFHLSLRALADGDNGNYRSYADDDAED